MRIIGIVAALTIPELLNNIANAQLKTAFKKAYSIASQDWEQVAAENPGAYNARSGWTCTWPDGTTADYSAADGKVEDFKAKMKVIKSCIGTTGCWPDEYEFSTDLLGKNKTGKYSPYSYSWVTADGMCWATPWHGLDDVHILVDTNCNKKPNKIGEDIFSMLLGADGVIYFAIDDNTTAGKPVSSGHVCPKYKSLQQSTVEASVLKIGFIIRQLFFVVGQECPTYLSDPATVNGRSVSFKIWL